jgi:hypothetical protein
MYTISNQFIIGRKFTAADPKIEYTCIGHGDAKENGRLLIVGLHEDLNKTATIRTFRDADVTFLPVS